MILGFGLIAVGYAVFYWGLHHFQSVDCDTPNGCRYSLVDLLGFPHGTIPGGTQGGTQINPPDTSTQTQNPNNAQTGSGFTGSTSTWAGGILQGVGAPCSGNNMAKMIAWNSCEGNLAGHSGLGINNPFNTTLQCCNSTGGVNSAGVQAYPSITQGIQATIQTLQAGRYKAVVSNLVNDGSFKAFASAVGSSGWGTSGSCISGQPSTAQPCDASKIPGAAGGVSGGGGSGGGGVGQSLCCQMGWPFNLVCPGSCG
jgi:hypothetical protein